MSSHASDQKTASAASTGAQANDKQLAANAQKNQQFSDQARQSLFGTYANGKYTGGSESQFLDPSTMNRTGLAGSYQDAYNNGSNTIARGAKDAVSTTQQNLASRGMGKTPAGFSADQERKAYQDAATSRGDLYSGLATQQHGEDVSNFQNANNMLNANATNTANLSLQGNQAAAGNYASLYGPANQQVQSGWAVAGQTLAGLGQAAATGYAGRKP
jgi:hypothetical protein